MAGRKRCINIAHAKSADSTTTPTNAKDCSSALVLSTINLRAMECDNPSDAESKQITPNSAGQPVQLAPPPSNAESKHITPNSAVQPVPLPPQLQLFFADCPPVPQIEVAFNNGNWWSIPEEINTLLFEQYAAGNDAVYT